MFTRGKSCIRGLGFRNVFFLKQRVSKKARNPGGIVFRPLSLNPNLFQRLVSFMADLREADGLLQRAIEKVDERSKVDTAQVRLA